MDSPERSLSREQLHGARAPLPVTSLPLHWPLTFQVTSPQFSAYVGELCAWLLTLRVLSIERFSEAQAETQDLDLGCAIYYPMTSGEFRDIQA